MIATRLPDNTYVTNKFDLTGALTNTFGSRVYPVAYTYYVQGRMKTMKTWKNFAANSGAATTTWNYNPYRGWLDNKRYDDNHGPNYTNTPAGRLKNRLWARGILTSYTYNNAGDPSTTIYSDTTPGVTNAFDRRGRVITVLNGGTTTSHSYDDAGNLLIESYAGGPLGGVGVTNIYDNFLRRTNVATVGTSTRYTYGEASRMATVSDGTNTATYSYLANSPLVSQISFANTGTVRMITTKAYDYLNRLTNIYSMVGGTNASSFAYAYNAANQRTSVTNVDATYWIYTYDSLGQVTSGKKYWSDHTPVAGQQFEYNFDDIGNRKSTAEGGDNTGINLRTANYTANSLNQYTSRDVPCYINILGSANSSATVSLWTDQGYWAQTERKGDYFRGELAVNNSTGALWLTITNVAALANATDPDLVTNTVGNKLLAKTSEAFSFDLDGNQLSDGLWTNSWDGENRNLITGNQSSIPAGAQLKETWKYMSDGRWTECVTATWNGSTYVPSETNRFVWDGQILLAMLNGTNGIDISFMRGLDLSGSTYGAGGVGGVLNAMLKTNGTHFFCYDGNGNVASLISTVGTCSAEYCYDPFGATLRASGQLALVNPIQFGTQLQEGLSRRVKYLHRDYAMPQGNWTSRDPIEESGGGNLYGSLLSDPVNHVDVLGLDARSTIRQGLVNYVRAYSLTAVAKASGVIQSTEGLLNSVEGISRVLVDPGVVGNYNARYDPANNVLYLKNLSPPPDLVTHEMVHAYNHLNGVGLDRDLRRNEGVAYVYQYLLSEHISAAATLEKFLIRQGAGATREQLIQGWQKLLWARTARPEQIAQITVPRLILSDLQVHSDRVDIENVMGIFGLHVSCGQYAQIINGILSSQQSQYRVCCGRTSTDPNIIPAGVDINEVFQ